MIWAWVPYSRAVLWCRSLFHWRWHLGLDLDHYFYFLWHLRSKGLAWRWVAPKDLRRPKQASYLSPLIEHDTSVPLMSKVVLLTDRTEVKRHWSISFSSSLGAVPLGAAVEFSLSHHPWELQWLFFFFQREMWELFPASQGKHRGVGEACPVLCGVHMPSQVENPSLVHLWILRSQYYFPVLQLFAVAAKQPDYTEKIFSKRWIRCTPGVLNCLHNSKMHGSSPGCFGALWLLLMYNKSEEAVYINSCIWEMMMWSKQKESSLPKLFLHQTKTQIYSRNESILPWSNPLGTQFWGIVCVISCLITMPV